MQRHILGYVAFITGGISTAGNVLATTEIYSPNGLCNFKLAMMPAGKNEHVLYLLNNKIYACGGQDSRDCYVYFISNDTWTLYATSNSSTFPYSVYNNKMYFSPYTDYAETLDLETKVWSSWPLPPKNKYNGCQVTWRDSFIRFGGSESNGGSTVQMFNHTTETWTTLRAKSFSTFDCTGCTLLPGDRVFLIGTTVNADQKKFTVYDIKANQWIFNGTQIYALQMPGVVTLGKRVFVIQGDMAKANIVQEFHYSNYSITSATFPQLTEVRQKGPAAVAVPARLFRQRLPNCTGIL